LTPTLSPSRLPTFQQLPTRFSNFYGGRNNGAGGNINPGNPFARGSSPPCEAYDTPCRCVTLLLS
jgi:hypothetical protein